MFRQPWPGLTVIGLILASLLAASPLRADDPPLLIDRYWQQLAETNDLIFGWQAAAPETRRTQMQAQAAHWAEVTAVVLADGSTVSVDHTFLVAQLRADPPDLVQIQGVLTTLLEARQTLAQAAWGGQEQGVLAEILRRPEFSWPAETLSPLQRLWRQLVQNFWGWVWRLLPDVGVSAASGSFTAYLLTTLGVLVLALILGYVLKNLVASFVAESEMDPNGALEAEALTVNTAFRQAQIFSEQGDYRTAVRYLYLSSLLLLEERELLRYDRSLTNREYLRNLAPRPELAAILREVIEVFDRVWYGYQVLDQAAYNQYAARVGELRRQR